MSGTLICGRHTATDSIVPVEVNADGTLEITAELSSAGLATEAKQDDIIADLTDGTQKSQILGNTEADGSGDSHHIHVDGSGNILVKEVGTVNVAPSNDTNSGITNDPANSMAVGIRGRTDIADAATETFLLTEATGRQVITWTDTNNIKLEDLSSQLNSGITNDPANSVAVGLRGRTDIADASTETFLKCDANGVLETSGSGGGGDATAANQTLQLAQETIIAGDTTSLDSKITQGYDAQIVSGGSGLQQIVCYGLDTGGDLDALRVDNSGHLEVTVDDFVKGQDTMANSFPVVIASDQSAVATSSAQLPASLGQKANASSISICRSTTAGAFDLSARTTIATAGTSTKLLCDSDGILHVNTLRDANVTSVTTTNVLANGTFTSSTLDLNGFSKMTMLGNTTNTTDAMRIEVSVDNVTFFKDPTSVLYDFSTGDFTAQLNNDGSAGAIRYVRLTQTDTTTTAFTVQFGASRR